MKKCYISCYSRITDAVVTVNGDTVLSRQSETQDAWLHDIYSFLNMNYPKFFKMDRLSKSGMVAAELLMRQTSIDPDTIKDDWAIVCMNRSSSLDDDTTYQTTIQQADNYFPSPSVFVYTLANIVTGELAIRYKIQGETSFYVSEKMDAETLCQTIVDTFQSNSKTHYVLCGWVEFGDNHCDVMMAIVTDSPKTGKIELTNSIINQIYQ